MIKWLKDLFNKSKQLVTKERELTDEEKQILNRLERNRDHSIHSIFHHISSYKTWFSNCCSIQTLYLIDGTSVEILGNWSYPDIDVTKRGTVCKGVEDGRIYELETRFALFFDRKPHTWVQSLAWIDQQFYCDSMHLYTDKELEEQFFSKISKQELRDIRLKELGIMLELDLDYDMTVDNMVPLTGEYKGWTNEEGEFYLLSDEKLVKMPYLLNCNKQIFQMKDGRFVLEVENIESDEFEVEYFYSYDINDLLK